MTKSVLIPLATLFIATSTSVAHANSIDLAQGVEVLEIEGGQRVSKIYLGDDFNLQPGKKAHAVSGASILEEAVVGSLFTTQSPSPLYEGDLSNIVVGAYSIVDTTFSASLQEGYAASSSGEVFRVTLEGADATPYPYMTWLHAPLAWTGEKAERVDVDSNGDIWVVTEGGDIITLSEGNAHWSFIDRPTPHSRFLDVGASNGEVYAVHEFQVSGSSSRSFGIYKLDQNFQFVPVAEIPEVSLLGGSGESYRYVDVDANGNILFVKTSFGQAEMGAINLDGSMSAPEYFDGRIYQVGAASDDN